MNVELESGGLQAVCLFFAAPVANGQLAQLSEGLCVEEIEDVLGVDVVALNIQCVKVGEV